MARRNLFGSVRVGLLSLLTTAAWAPWRSSHAGAGYAPHKSFANTAEVLEGVLVTINALGNMTQKRGLPISCAEHVEAFRQLFLRASMAMCFQRLLRQGPLMGPGWMCAPRGRFQTGLFPLHRWLSDTLIHPLEDGGGGRGGKRGSARKGGQALSNPGPPLQREPHAADHTMGYWDGGCVPPVPR